MNWSPKPLRPTGQAGQVSGIIEKSVVSRERNPMQVQRDKDGTPHTRHGHSKLRAEQPQLVLDGVVQKSVSEDCEEKKEDPTKILKSYFEFHGITV